MSTRRPAAVFWDMDGTLVDTEPYWMQAQTELVDAYGGHWTHEKALTVVGKSLWITADAMRAAGVDMEPLAIIELLTDRVLAQVAVRMPWRPGAEALLTDLRDQGVRTALVTMSIRRMAEDVVAAVGFDAFDTIVSLSDVVEPKPHPEPYLRAAELLGVDAHDCVALEDSPTGVASGAASGAVTIGVPHYIPLDETPADLLWDTLVGRNTESINAAFSSVRERQTQERV